MTTLLAAAGGAAIASLVKLPAAPLLGAMAGVASVKIAGQLSFDIPPVGRWLIYCAVGWLLGQTLTRESLSALRSNAALILACVALFVVFGLVLAVGIWRFTDLDMHTALLATAPGGVAQIGVLSAEVKANVPVVLAVHILRITSVIVLMSVGLRVMGGRS